MENIFRYDSKFIQVLDKIADIIILNLLFIISCIPVITIGSSITSMYYVTLKMVRDEDSSVIKLFIKSFKENFKVSTIVWGLIILSFGILIIDFKIADLISIKSLSIILRASSIMISIIFILSFTYVFPIIARFENSIKNTIINSALMSIQNLHFTAIIVILNLLPIILINIVGSLWPYILFLYIMSGFALVSYINSIFLNKIFNKYIKAT